MNMNVENKAAVAKAIKIMHNFVGGPVAPGQMEETVKSIWYLAEAAESVDREQARFGMGVLMRPLVGIQTAQQASESAELLIDIFTRQQDSPFHALLRALAAIKVWAEANGYSWQEMCQSNVNDYMPDDDDDVYDPDEDDEDEDEDDEDCDPDEDDDYIDPDSIQLTELEPDDMVEEL